MYGHKANSSSTYSLGSPVSVNSQSKNVPKMLMSPEKTLRTSSHSLYWFLMRCGAEYLGGATWSALSVLF